MADFDQFANQGGAAAGDADEAAAARKTAEELLKKSASAANDADFGTGPLTDAAPADDGPLLIDPEADEIL